MEIHKNHFFDNPLSEGFAKQNSYLTDMETRQETLNRVADIVCYYSLYCEYVKVRQTINVEKTMNIPTPPTSRYFSSLCTVNENLSKMFKSFCKNANTKSITPKGIHNYTMNGWIQEIGHHICLICSHLKTTPDFLITSCIKRTVENREQREKALQKENITKAHCAKEREPRGKEYFRGLKEQTQKYFLQENAEHQQKPRDNTVKENNSKFSKKNKWNQNL